jgi:hypothetical protein
LARLWTVYLWLGNHFVHFILFTILHGELNELFQQIDVLLSRKRGHFARSISPTTVEVTGRAILDVQMLATLWIGLERHCFLQLIQRSAALSLTHACRKGGEQ